MKILTKLIACGALSISLACTSPGPRVLPDPTLPHRVAERAAVKVWVRMPDGRLSAEYIEVGSGWWVAGPEALEGGGGQ